VTPIVGSAALVLLALTLAWANGSNDVSKGIATLVGSGVSDLRTAVAWGTLWTVAGGVAAAWAAQGLVAVFSGSGFLGRPESGGAFLASVAAGAIVWVFLASRTGLPVSTTHALAGALAGAGIVAQGASALHWGFLGRRVALPLAASPILAVLLLSLVFPLLERFVDRAGAYCVCVERRVAILPDGAAGFLPVAEKTIVDEGAACDVSPAIARRINAVDAMHWTSSAMTSFARGLNDTPKILAIAIGASAFLGIAGRGFYLLVAIAMGAGSLAGGVRVTDTLARRVTRMSPGEGFSANVVTTILVVSASLAALPVSTTHVSSGAIVGIGLRGGAKTVRWSTVGSMALAWLVTLPVSALAAAGFFLLLR